MEFSGVRLGDRRCHNAGAVRLLPWQEAVTAVGSGADVYLFLIGMTLLSAVARKEGLFDWLATEAVTHARGSAKRLFLIIYVIGILVTSFLSNDATAVVMTPAVYAAARAAQVEPLPYLFICAFIANAAVLPSRSPILPTSSCSATNAGSSGVARLFCLAIVCCHCNNIRCIAANAAEGARCEARCYH